MTGRARATLPDGSMNLTSLIDVVFLLIVFFMLVGEMARQDAVELVLPEAARGEPDEDGPNRLVVNLSREGECWVRGRRLADGEFRGLLDGWAHRAGTGRGERVDGVVKIRADVLTEWRHMQTVMLDCMGARVLKVASSVTPSRSGIPGGGPTPAERHAAGSSGEDPTWERRASSNPTRTIWRSRRR